MKTAVLVTFEGNEWVVRSMSSAAGTLEMRFREVPVGFAQVDVRGTIRGAAFDMVSPPYKLFASETRALFGDSGPVDVSGHGDTSYSYAGGQMAGPIRFADSQGSTGECTAILWGLLPGPGL